MLQGVGPEGALTRQVAEAKVLDEVGALCALAFGRRLSIVEEPMKNSRKKNGTNNSRAYVRASPDTNVSFKLLKSDVQG